MTLNLEDIARLSGVSRSTVSRVINNNPYVSEKTRQRVLEVIKEQDFRPNLAARALVTQRTRTLSMVIPQALGYTFTDPYFPALLQGVIEKANEHDHAVMLWIGSSAEEEDRFRSRIVSNNLVDGVIIASAFQSDPLIPSLARNDFPFVLVGPPPIPNLNFVDVDNQRAAQVAVSHLIRLGWKRIGTITGPQKMGAGQARLDGYRRAFERANLPVDEALIVQGNFDEMSGYLGMRTLLSRSVDAVFAASDMMALGALRAIRERGLRVPEDIGIVGFDDMPVAAATTPPLTTVRQPIRELGALAAQMLIGLLDQPASRPNQIILQAQLIVRDTCGATQM